MLRFGFGVIIHIPNFMKIGSGIQELTGDADTLHLITSLLYLFPQIRKAELEATRSTRC
jgi:hypothetical protein